MPPNRVEVSNGIGWLVDYYYDHGQTDKAMAIARDAAEVYSSRGLQTMMRPAGENGPASTTPRTMGRKIVERYNESDALAGFYKRCADKGPGRFPGEAG